jgi:hypothetical protein
MLRAGGRRNTALRLLPRPLVSKGLSKTPQSLIWCPAISLDLNASASLIELPTRSLQHKSLLPPARTAFFTFDILSPINRVPFSSGVNKRFQVGASLFG